MLEGADRQAAGGRTTSRWRPSSAAFGPATVGSSPQPLLGGIHAGDIERCRCAAVFPRLRGRRARRGSSSRAPSTGAVAPATASSERCAAAWASSSRRSRARLPAGSVRLRTRAVRDCVARRERNGASTTGDERIDARGRDPGRACARRGALLARLDADARRALRRGAVRLDRQRRARLAARDVSPSARGQRLRRRAPAQRRCASRRAPGSRRSGRIARPADTRAAARLPRRRAPIPARSTAVRRGAGRHRGARRRQRRSAPRRRRALSRVQRWPNAGAQHNVGHARARQRIDARLRALPGLFVAGSGFRAIGIPDCVADGRAAAGRMRAAITLR